MQNTLQIFVNDALTPSDMTAREARHCVESIKAHMTNARILVKDLYDRQGWKALGYASWRECVVAEFEQSKTHLYRQLEAARIEENISPMGEIGTIPERQLRPLTTLEPEQQRTAWEAAIATADTLKEAVTAAIVAAAVNVVKDTPQATEPAIQEIFTTDNDELVHAVIQEYQTQKVKEKPAKQPAKPHTTLPDTGPLSPTEGYRGPTSKAEVNANWIWGRMQDFERDGYLDMGARTIFDHMHPHQKLTIARLIKPILQFFHELETFL